MSETSQTEKDIAAALNPPKTEWAIGACPAFGQITEYQASCLRCSRVFVRSCRAGTFDGLCDQCRCPEGYHEGLLDEEWQSCPDCGFDLYNLLNKGVMPHSE